MPDIPLRICLLSYRGNPHCGGQGVYVRYLSRALNNLGHQVDVISGPPYPVLGERIKLFRIPSLDLYNPENLFRMPTLKELVNPINFLEWLGVSSMGFPEPFTFGLRVNRFIKRHCQKYDIVHDNQSLSYGVQGIQKCAPTIATIHHPITIDRKLAVKTAPSFWKKLQHLRWYSFIGMQKKVSRTFSRIITVSNRAREDISKDFSIPVDKFRVIPNGIDTEIFHPLPGVDREKNRVIVTNSSDTPLKGLRYLLQAVAQVSKSHRVKLVVVGAPHKNGNIKKFVRKWDLEECTTFTGRISNTELVKHYAKAAVAVVPSVYEGFGFPAGEAMACGTPIISTAGGALPEVVGDAGILIPPADPSALFRALTNIFDNPDRASELGHAGRIRAHKLFSWENAARKTTSAYRETIRDYRRAS